MQIPSKTISLSSDGLQADNGKLEDWNGIGHIH